jgi:hypothetical protein
MQEAVSVVPVTNRPAGVDNGIKVGTLNVRREKKAAPSVSAEGKQAAGEVQKQVETRKLAEEKVLGIETLEKAREALAGKMENARMALRILSGGDSTLNILAGQEDAEYSIAHKIQDPKERQQKIKEIQDRYQKLTSYAETRQKDMVSDINRLKKSEKPENRALAMDIEIFRNKAGAQAFERSINNINLILKANIDPATGQELSGARKARLQQERDFYQKEMEDLIAKNGVAGKEGLINQRENLRDEKGGEIPHMLDNLAVALTDGSADSQKIAKEDPVSFLEDVMAKALTNKEEMNHLADNLVKSKILDEKDKQKFIEDMELGLTAGARLEMIKDKGGRTVMSLISVLGMLGYVAWKKIQEGGGQQMMG